MTKELVRLFFINAMCGATMWVALCLVIEEYKRRYIVPLVAITAICLTFVVNFGTLFALGIALAVYLTFLVLANPEPAFPWCLPAAWLAAHGAHLVTVKQMVLSGKVIAFFALAAVTIICPFLPRNGENADDGIVHRNKLLVWSSLVIGLAGCLVTIVVQ